MNTEKPARPKKSNAQSRRDIENRERAAGRVQRKRWAHPEDWPEIDAYIKAINNRRSNP